jgi:hypothetical protein
MVLSETRRHDEKQTWAPSLRFRNWVGSATMPTFEWRSCSQRTPRVFSP